MKEKKNYHTKQKLIQEDDQYMYDTFTMLLSNRDFFFHPDHKICVQELF